MLAIEMILQLYDTPYLQFHLCTAIFVCNDKHVSRIWVACSEQEFILSVFPGFTNCEMEKSKFEPIGQMMLLSAAKVDFTESGRAV